MASLALSLIAVWLRGVLLLQFADDINYTSVFYSDVVNFNFAETPVFFSIASEFGMQNHNMITFFHH